MNELSNAVTGSGSYEGTPISVTSNTSIVKIVEGLTLVLAADKKYWKDGNLKYTITLNNATDVKYETITISDVIDTKYISFVDGTIEINGAKAQASEYNYDEASHTLTINLDGVEPQESTTINFEVKKNETCTLLY